MNTSLRTRTNTLKAAAPISLDNFDACAHLDRRQNDYPELS